MKDLVRTIKSLVWLALFAAVYQELRKPPEQRTWHGKVAGVVPYDFRMPTFERLRETYWNPELSPTSTSPRAGACGSHRRTKCRVPEFVRISIGPAPPMPASPSSARSVMHLRMHSLACS